MGEDGVDKSAGIGWDIRSGLAFSWVHALSLGHRRALRTRSYTSKGIAESTVHLFLGKEFHSVAL